MTAGAAGSRAEADAGTQAKAPRGQGTSGRRGACRQKPGGPRAQPLRPGGSAFGAGEQADPREGESPKPLPPKGDPPWG